MSECIVRGTGEGVEIGGCVTITVRAVNDGGRVLLVIEAPQNLLVRRTDAPAIPQEEKERHKAAVLKEVLVA